MQQGRLAQRALRGRRARQDQSALRGLAARQATQELQDQPAQLEQPGRKAAQGRQVRLVHRVILARRDRPAQLARLELPVQRARPAQPAPLVLALAGL